MGSAAGIFTSAVNVPQREVWAAVRAVWASAFTPLVAAYARAVPGTATPSLAIAVIVQRFVAGQRATIYTRPPRGPLVDDVWVQRDSTLTHGTRDAHDPLITLALAAERAVAATAGADVELILDGEAIWLVQARPLAHPPTRRPTRAPPDSLLAALRSRSDGPWHWDIAHNPSPLSSAQSGLVELVDRAGLGAYHLATVAGYLYAQRRATTHSALEITNAEQLEREFVRLESAMAKTLDENPPTLAAALDSYLAFYEIWADQVAPLLAASRASVARVVASIPKDRIELHRALHRRLTQRPHSVAARIAATARGEIKVSTLLDEVGDFAPAWDVAVPTYREQPEALHAAVAAPCIAEPAPADDLGSFVNAGELALACAAVSLGERDDWYFARAQAMVRHALLVTSQRLHLAEDDVFWLPFEDLTADDHWIDIDQLHARARAARNAAARAQQWSMPLTIGGDATFAAMATNDAESWLGHGDGPRVTGIVARVGLADGDSSTATIAPGAVAVARAITPALAVWLRGARAIVSDAGDPLDHGAAIAREFSIPFVSGAAGVWAALEQGDVIEVDGDAGIVRRVTSHPEA